MKDELIIRPPKGFLGFDLKEIWAHRELAYFFAWRDIKIRYKQTLVGILWVLLQPLMAMFIFTVFFGKFARMPSDNIPYPIFVYVGILLWNYFSSSLSRASESMVSNANIIQKTYFPRLIIPVASSLVGLIDFAIGACILVIFMAIYHFIPSVKILIYLPLLILVIFFSSVGAGCFFASLNVKYRDVRHAMPFLIQVMMFITPVIYPMSMVGDKYKWFFLINPIAGVIETSRAVIFGARAVDINILVISALVSTALFIFGVVYFRRTERYFADIV